MPRLLRRAQAVELGRQTPVAGALVGIGPRAPAALGRRDHPGFGAPVAQRRGEPVIAWRQRRQFEGEFARVAEGRPSLADGAALVDEAPRDMTGGNLPGTEAAGRDPRSQRDAERAPRLDRQEGGDQTGAQALHHGEARGDRGIVLHRDSRVRRACRAGYRGWSRPAGRRRRCSRVRRRRGRRAFRGRAFIRRLSSGQCRSRTAGGPRSRRSRWTR